MPVKPFARPIVAALALLCLWMPGVALGQQMTPEDRDRIEARINQLSGHVRAGDFGATLDVVPPRLKAVLLNETGIDEASLKREMNRIWADLLREEELSLFGFDIDLAAASERVTPNGQHTYLAIPTETRLKVENSGSFRIRTQTLALEDNGQWYLIRMDRPEQTALLIRAYPGFDGVIFPASETVID